jgi:hypothetical protein
MRRMLLLALFAGAATALLAVIGASATAEAKSSATPVSVVVSTKMLPKLGTVLVNSKGRALYRKHSVQHDTPHQIRCTYPASESRGLARQSGPRGSAPCTASRIAVENRSAKSDVDASTLI